MTSVKKHLSPKSLIGPGKSPGLSRNGPQVHLIMAKATDALYKMAHFDVLLGASVVTMGPQN